MLTGKRTHLGCCTRYQQITEGLHTDKERLVSWDVERSLLVLASVACTFGDLKKANVGTSSALDLAASYRGSMSAVGKGALIYHPGRQPDEE